MTDREEAVMHFLRGNVEFRRGNNLEAYKLYTSAREYFHANGEPIYEGLAIGNQGRIHERLGNYPKAAEFFASAQDLFEANNAPRPGLRNRLNIFNVSTEGMRHNSTR